VNIKRRPLRAAPTLFLWGIALLVLALMTVNVGAFRTAGGPGMPGALSLLLGGVGGVCLVLSVVLGVIASVAARDQGDD